jgi:hypothetical protein
MMIKVDLQECATLKTGIVDGQNVVCRKPLTGRKVKLIRYETVGMLNLCEVQIYGKST